MGIVTGIILILCGVLGAASYIVAKRPDAKETIDKLTPIQGWLGVIVCLWGIWTVITALLHMNLLSIIPVWWVTLLATGLVMTCLGFLLGYGLIQQYALANNESAAARGEMVRARLATYQTTLGLISIGLGVWCVIAAVIYL